LSRTTYIEKITITSSSTISVRCEFNDTKNSNYKHAQNIIVLQVNLILRENEFSYTFPEADSVVFGFETNQLGANTPCEDTRTEASFIHKNGTALLTKIV